MQKADFRFERRFWRNGASLVAGVDEVGRGAWAGPLYAAAVIFPPKVKLDFPLADSKLLAPKKRPELAEEIKLQALAFAVAQAETPLIERCGISFATEYAMLKALEELGLTPDFVLVDFFRIRSFPRWKQEAIKAGDRLSATIAAASILAKVERDAKMKQLAKQYPNYGFEAHVGYGTKMHQQMIKKHGLCEIHRISFIPERLL